MASPFRDIEFLLAIVLLAALLVSAGCFSSDLSTSANSGRGTATPGLTFYSEERPPYSYIQNGTLRGSAVDLLEAVTAGTGSPVNRNDILLASWTWSDEYLKAVGRNGTVFVALARTPELEEEFKWAGPIATDRYVLFARRDTGIAIGDHDNLTGYRIGVAADDAGALLALHGLVNASGLIIEQTPSRLAERLQKREIDLWCSQEASGRYYAAAREGDHFAFRIAHAFEEFGLYYAFNNTTPDATVASFQQVLDTLKQDHDIANRSTYDRIMGTYNPSVGLSQLSYLAAADPPLSYQERGVVKGIGVEILEAVWRDLSVNLTRMDIRMAGPQEDNTVSSRNRTGTVLFPVRRSPDGDPLSTWAGPLGTSSVVLYAPTSRSVGIFSVADLKHYRIGTVRDSTADSLLVASSVGEDQAVRRNDLADLFRMLEQGEIPLVASRDMVGQYQFVRTGTDAKRFEIVYVLGDDDYYFTFSRDTPDLLVDAFQHALVRLREDGDGSGSEYEKIVYRNLGVACVRPGTNDSEVMALVNATAGAIERSASGAIQRLNAGETPFRNTANPDLYAVVYDTNLTVRGDAHSPSLVGRAVKGNPDLAGTPFRDQILTGALAKGAGWVDYVGTGSEGLVPHARTAYYRLVSGSDGKQYIVSSSKAKSCR